MAAPKEPSHVRCPTCRRPCAVGNWSCDLFAGKAYCPLCGEPTSLHEFMKRTGMLGNGSRASIRPAFPTVRRQKE